MTIQTELRRAGAFESDGEQLEFPFNFKIFNKEDLVVTIGNSDRLNPDNKILQLESDYTVDFDSDNETGKITLTAPIEAGKLLVITSDIPELQNLKLENKGGMFPKDIERTLDKIVALIQQAREKLDRSILIPNTVDESPEDYLLTYEQRVVEKTEIVERLADEVRTSIDEANETLAEIKEFQESKLSELSDFVEATSKDLKDYVDGRKEEIDETVNTIQGNAEQYLENVKNLSEQYLGEIKNNADNYLAATKITIDESYNSAQSYLTNIKTNSDSYLESVKGEANAYLVLAKQEADAVLENTRSEISTALGNATNGIADAINTAKNQATNEFNALIIEKVGETQTLIDAAMQDIDDSKDYIDAQVATAVNQASIAVENANVATSKAELANASSIEAKAQADRAEQYADQVSSGQVNADWDAESGKAQILNKPNLSAVATSGSYNDLEDKPQLFDGSYNSLTDKPELFDGDYNSLSNKPDLSVYATSQDVSDTYATKEELPDVSDMATNASVDTKLQAYSKTEDISIEYATKEELQNIDALPSGGEDGYVLTFNATTGLAEWKPQKSGGGSSGYAVGDIFYSMNPNRGGGAYLAYGGTISATLSPEYTQFAGTKFGGDGVTTVGLPDLQNVYITADELKNLGDKLNAQSPNIKGKIEAKDNTEPVFLCSAPNTSGSLTASSPTQFSYNLSQISGQATKSFSIDASLSSSVYSDDATTIRPDSIIFYPYVQVYNEVVNETKVDVTELAKSKSVPIASVMYTCAKVADTGYIKLDDEMTYVPVGAFPKLFSKAYVGDANNDTAPYYFKCDSEGNNRSVTGEYFALPSNKQVGRFLIESGTDSVTGISYSIFSDGWLEQYGILENNSGWSTQVINFPFSFKDISYIVNAIASEAQQITNTLVVSAKTVDSVTLIKHAYDDLGTWCARGYIAQSDMPAIKGIVQIKAWDDVINTGEVDVQSLVNELQNSKVVSTIIYPNGGTAESPANVTINQRIVMDNPYEGYYVDCRAQVMYQDKWGYSGHYTDYTSASNCRFIEANQLFPDDKVIIQTANYALIMVPNVSGSPIDFTTGRVTTAPCRVIVTRLGKIPS